MWLWLGLALVAGSLIVPSSASAVGGVKGTITITGTDGGENVSVRAVNGYGEPGTAAGQTGPGLVITPFVTVTAPLRDGASICTPTTDTLTRRPSGVECRPADGDILSLAVNLQVATTR